MQESDRGQLNHRNSNTNANSKAFGSEVSDFPHNSDWKSPFASPANLETLSLFEKFTVSFSRPSNWSTLQLPKEDTKLALFSPERNATLMIGAGVLPEPALPPGKYAERIAGTPFLTLLQYGAKSPLLMTIPICSEDGDRGHLVNGPLMARGVMVGIPDLPHCPMFKYTVVIEKEGHWFSFESQSWGTTLDISVEGRTQAEMFSRFKVANA